MREDATYQNPRGRSWKMISRNEKQIKYIESTNFDVIYGIDQNNVLYYANKKDLNQLDNKWVPVPNMDAITKTGDLIEKISCNHFSCWVVTSSNSVYVMKTPWDPTQSQWRNDYGKQIIVEIC